MLTRKQGKPLYRQISDVLEKEVQQLYQPADNLPSEQEMADRFSVNRHTLRRAIDELVNKGLVERVHGRGVYVLDVPINYGIGKDSRLTESLAALGKTSDLKLLRKLEIKAQGNVADSLEIAEGSPVIWLETLRSVDGNPFCLISHYLPIQRLGGAVKEYQSGSLHDFLKGLGVNPVRKKSTVTAVLPMDEDAMLLVMPTQQPVLRVKTLNCDAQSGLPVEYALTRFRADRAQLSINIE